MAASGTQEHFEARRRDRHYYQKAYILKHGNNLKPEQVIKNREMLEAAKRLDRGTPSSYDRQVQHLQQQGRHGYSGPEEVDRQRRSAHYQQMCREYSAKIPNRYSTFDYISQW